jgi:hypothetical protein
MFILLFLLLSEIVKLLNFSIPSSIEKFFFKNIDSNFYLLILLKMIYTYLNRDRWE